MKERIGASSGFYDYLSGYIGSAPDSDTNRYLKEWCDGIVESKRFTWIGIVEKTDELERSRIAVYLLENVEKGSLSESEHRANRKYLDNHTKVSLAMRKTVRLDVYFMLSTRFNPLEAKHRIQTRINEEQENSRLLWEKSFTSLA